MTESSLFSSQSRDNNHNGNGNNYNNNYSNYITDKSPEKEKFDKVDAILNNNKERNIPESNSSSRSDSIHKVRFSEAGI
jgi:hypothetical protein